ncbi:F-box protein At5g07610-like [Impatiens glandulifera]|uniref:F-box protein At5g07610-like n=1 Tax=Impatiens glandulifera TaxID=253017 RepID=UPI001FB0625E|nr:F-box protein At5g07610-like [Impatiens glandulifera]
MSKQHRFNEEPPPSASEKIEGNDDLLKEILRRFPAKSLLRSSCVSKRWLSLISDPHFSLLWSKPKSHTVPGMFLRRLPLPSNTPTIDYVPLNRDQYHHENPPINPLDSGIKSVEEDDIDVLQSCNGLLLCSSFRLRHHSCNFYVYNPTTNKYRALPRPIGFGEKIVRGVSIAFDPSKSHHYKVICVSSHSKLLKGISWVQIYSSQTHTWRVYDDILVGPFDVDFETGVFWNGSINWISRASETSLRFDVDSESSNILPMPPLTDGLRVQRRFAFFNVCLGDYLHIGLFTSAGAQLEVFTMERDFSKWVLKYLVNLEATIMELHMPVPLPLVYWKFLVLGCFWDETEKESSCLMIYIPGKIGCYNIEEKCLKNVCDLNISSNEGWIISPTCKWVAGYPYIESLCCV